MATARRSISVLAALRRKSSQGTDGHERMGKACRGLRSSSENHVSVSMTFELFSELMLMTKTHYQSWLTAYYLQNPIKSATLPAQETYAAPDNAPNTLF